MFILFSICIFHLYIFYLFSLVKCLFRSYAHFFLKILFIYLIGRDHKQAERQAEREVEAGSLLSTEPDVGLDPRTPGSWPEPKAEALTYWATQAPLQCLILNTIWSDATHYLEQLKFILKLLLCCTELCNCIIKLLIRYMHWHIDTCVWFCPCNTCLFKIF